MMKKMFAYQRLLFCSASRPAAGDSIRLSRQVTGLCVFALMLALAPLIGFSVLNAAIPLTGVILVYRMLNGDVRLFEQVPVSRGFIAANIYLFAIVTAVVTYIGVQLLLVALVLLLFMLALLFGSVTPGGSDFNPAAAAGEWKNFVFSLLVYTLIISVGIALSMIKERRTRVLSISLVGAAGYMLLWLIKLSMPGVPGEVPSMNGIDLMPYFSLSPHARMILIVLAAAWLVVVPVSVRFGARRYCRDDSVRSNP